MATISVSRQGGRDPAVDFPNLNEGRNRVTTERVNSSSRSSRQQTGCVEPHMLENDVQSCMSEKQELTVVRYDIQIQSGTVKISTIM